jgi:hypothetical protein
VTVEEIEAVAEELAKVGGLSWHPGHTQGPILRVGGVVVFRPPGDRRAVLCRIDNLEEGHAYLVPFAKPDIGWVAMDTLQP